MMILGVVARQKYEICSRNNGDGDSLGGSARQNTIGKSKHMIRMPTRKGRCTCGGEEEMMLMV
jgi:hypothetical protein